MSVMIGEETAQGIFERDWLHILDDRKIRGWDQKPDERNDREYVPHVDPAKIIPGAYYDKYADVY